MAVPLAVPHCMVTAAVGVDERAAVNVISDVPAWPSARVALPRVTVGGGVGTGTSSLRMVPVAWVVAPGAMPMK
ncbi:hypothetical protein D3C71_1260830 [compost metagenome]